MCSLAFYCGDTCLFVCFLSFWLGKEEVGQLSVHVTGSTSEGGREGGMGGGREGEREGGSQAHPPLPFSPMKTGASHRRFRVEVWSHGLGMRLGCHMTVSNLLWHRISTTGIRSSCHIKEEATAVTTRDSSSLIPRPTPLFVL